MKYLINSIIAIALAVTVNAQTVVSPDDKAYWNGYVDYVKEQGYQNSPELNKNGFALSAKLWNDYAKKLGVDAPEFVPFVINVQKSIIDYREQSIAKIKSGEAECENCTVDTFMSSISTADGKAGAKTTAWKFPGISTKKTTIITIKHGYGKKLITTQLVAQSY